MESNIRSKSDFINAANWQQLHAMTTHWYSEFEFYKDEIEFMKKLIDKYFIWLVQDENINILRGLVKKITGQEETIKSLLNQIAKHLKQIAQFMDRAAAYDQQKFKNEHLVLGDKLNAFIDTFRELKKEQFELVEKVLKTEKLQHLIAK